MLLRYLDEILDTICEIKKKNVISKQHAFVEAVYYYSDAISNSLKKIRDAYKEDPTTIDNYSDITLKLLLDQMDQLRRDFSYEEKCRKRNKQNGEHIKILKDSFQKFSTKAQNTIKEVEKLVSDFELDIKITYSVDSYFCFSELFEQLQNDLPEETDSFDFVDDDNEGMNGKNYLPKWPQFFNSDRKNTKPLHINLISKRFWTDNFGDQNYIDFIEFFEKFKNYVFETEKTNIDEIQSEALKKFLDLGKNLKVRQFDWNIFFSNEWLNFDFRKNFLAHKDQKLTIPIELPILKLSYVFEEDDHNISFEIEINMKECKKRSEQNEETLQHKDISCRPLIFGREIKSFKPDISFSKDPNISRKQFQICAYNNYKGEEGYYISDLSLSERTSFQIGEKQNYILDEGSLFKINEKTICVSQINPRYNKDEELQSLDDFYVPTHIFSSDKEHNICNCLNAPNPFIVLDYITEEGIEKEKEIEQKNHSNHYQQTIYIYANEEEQKGGDKNNKQKEKLEILKEEKKNLCADAIIRYENGKWILTKDPNSKSEEVLVYLINREELLHKEISWGCKLKNNMKINCQGHTFSVSIQETVKKNIKNL